MANDLISRDAVLGLLEDRWYGRKGTTNPFDMATCDVLESIIDEVKYEKAVDAVPLDVVAEMLADLFGEECCCNYNGIDEWLPMLCEHSDTCPEAIGKNGCWKQFIKHWKERKKNNE